MMKISVIVPCYNVEQYIDACLNSVMSAVREVGDVCIEAICVNDGSCDGTRKILDRWRERVSFIRVVHQENAGEGAARNTGLSLASGEWIMFVDSDDLIAERTFVDVVNAIVRFPDVDLVRFSTSTFDDGKAPAWTGEGSVSFADLRSELPAAICMYGITEMAYRRSKFGMLRFGDYRVGADLVFTSQCFGVAGSLAAVDHANYGYRVRSNSMAHCAMTPLKMRSQISYLHDMLENYVSCGKRLPVTITRGRGNRLIEGCVGEILSHKEIEWCCIWQDWLSALDVIRHNRVFGVWQRMVAGAIAVSESRLLARILCQFPYWLKLNGIHR